MRRALGLALALAVAAPAGIAQTGGTIEVTPLDAPEDSTAFDERPGFENVTRDAVEPAGGAVLRALDKVSGEVREIEMANGDLVEMGLIEIVLGECRYPQGNPAGDAFAWVEVRTPARDSVDFRGWMIASSPALNALDHARYDVWVMRCTNV